MAFHPISKTRFKCVVVSHLYIAFIIDKVKYKVIISAYRINLQVLGVYDKFIFRWGYDFWDTPRNVWIMWKVWSIVKFILFYINIYTWIK